MTSRICGVLVGLGVLLQAAERPASADIVVPRTGDAARDALLPGLVPGFLPPGEALDSLDFLPAAPSQDSLLQGMDDAWAWTMLGLRETQRWDQAARDAVLSFPEAADHFSCALGLRIDPLHTPALVRLLQRSLTDLGLSTVSAKEAYRRPRPFMVTGTPICTPKDAAKLRRDGSYPSGHAAIGWGWALILSELRPDRAEAILRRGLEFGDSRTVCNVHWSSDVRAGRLAGAAAVARLHTHRDFLLAMKAAQAELKALTRKSPSAPRSCPEPSEN